MQVKSINQIKFVSTPNFRAKEQDLPTVEAAAAQNISMKGAEVLANYNALLINPKKSFEVEPTELIFTPDMDIEGEKVYSSDGKLKAIVKDEDDTRTIYSVSDDNEDVIEDVEIFDKKTNNTIAKQYTYGDNFTSVLRYDNGKLISESNYKNGQRFSSSKYEYKGNGITKCVCHDIEDNSYYVDFKNEKTNEYKSIRLDENAKVVDFSEHKEKKNRSIDLEASFYNGGLYSLRKSESMTMPSLLGHDKLADPNLAPIKGVEISELVKLPDSQKSFYSNGNLEKCVDGNKTINFDLNGKLVSITEKLENGDEKTTEFYNDGKNKAVTISSDNNTYKQVNYNEQNKPTAYHEGTKQDGGERGVLSLYFDKQGMLDGAYKF